MADEIKKEAKKTADTAKKDKKTAPKPAKKKNEVNFFIRAGRKIKKFFKDVKGECKKIVWPTGKMVLKSTGVVFAVVTIVALSIYAVDTGLSYLLKYLVKLAGETGAEGTTTAMIFAFLGR